jgi:hypothetical protein
MTRTANITARLPGLYRDGDLLGAVLDQPALALEILDEDTLEVQRAHWFDAALELDEVARLAAVLDIGPEPWQDLGEFRAWVHALLAAMLEHGAVGVRALQVFVEQYLARLALSAGVPRLLLETPAKAEDWRTDPATASPTDATSRPAFYENPPVRRQLRVTGTEPLQKFTATNGGLAPVTASFLLVGLPAGPEYVPVLANASTGRAVAYLDAVPPGQRLWLRADGTARLENRDVTAAVRTVARLTPGQPWQRTDVDPAPTPITLQRGANELWFLPVAHYGAPGLDRVLLALAGLELTQGRYDQSSFDAALFVMDPGVAVTVGWTESAPATVLIELPGGGLLSRAGRRDAAYAVRDDLGRALDQGVGGLAAAGVRTAVTLAPFREEQPQTDYLTGRIPLVMRERGPTGADRLPESGGLFDVTGYQDSNFG